ncbi:unnamed protein product [Closterium sp. Naga37s-1]|nr:unnamed protein product [Closterium sp. Naga37s-1]
MADAAAADSPAVREVASAAQRAEPGAAESAAPRSVLIQNGVAKVCQMSAADLLRSYPRGAYTTARTVGVHSVLEFDMHVQRLVESAGLMGLAVVPCGATGESSGHQEKGRDSCRDSPDAPAPPVHTASASAAAAAAADSQLTFKSLRPVIKSAFAQAIKEFLHCNATLPHATTSSTATASQATPAASTSAAASPPPTLAPPSSSSSSPSPFSSPSPSSSSRPPMEVRLTALLAPPSSPSSTQPYDLFVHAAPLPPPPSPPVRVVVAGRPRKNPAAKDSAWARERAALEEVKRQQGAEEVLLVDSDGSVLEGSTSNFFAVEAGGVVVTAEEGVLKGTIRSLILSVCQQQGVPVQLRAPQVGEAYKWQGAFISSTSRLLLPLDTLLLPSPQARAR